MDPVNQTPETVVEQPTKMEPNRTFTQDELNRFLAEEKRKFQKDRTDLANKLESLIQEKNYTAEQAAELNQQIEQLRTMHQSKEATLEEKHKREVTTLSERVKNFEKEAGTWKEQFEKQLLETTLVTAAKDANVKNVGVAVEYLRNKAKIIPVVDAITGKKQPGSFTVVLPWMHNDAKEGPTELPVSPSEYLRKMREDVEQFGFFFNSEQTGGLGAQGGNQSGSLNTDAGIEDFLIRKRLIKPGRK